MTKIFKVPEVDENMHLYLAYRGLHGDYAVMDVIKKWMNEGEMTNEVNRFIELNKDNEKVMKYINN